MTMIDRIITDYLAQHKRLVIPGFGAFIRKDEDGTVVFVEFLKKDDHILLPLLAAELGTGRDAACDALDEYVAFMKRRISQSGSYVIEGLGVMRLGKNASYELVYDPQARAVCGGGQSASTDPEFVADAEETAFGMEKTVFEAIDAVFGGDRLNETVVTGSGMGDRACADLSSPTDSEHGTEIVFDESDAKRQPPANRPRGGKKKTDWIIILAIVAAILALIAIIFSAISGSSPHFDIWNNAADTVLDSIPPPVEP